MLENPGLFALFSQAAYEVADARRINRRTNRSVIPLTMLCLDCRLKTRCEPTRRIVAIVRINSGSLQDDVGVRVPQVNEALGVSIQRRQCLSGLFTMQTVKQPQHWVLLWHDPKGLICLLVCVRFPPAPLSL